MSFTINLPDSFNGDTITQIIKEATSAVLPVEEIGPDDLGLINFTADLVGLHFVSVPLWQRYPHGIQVRADPLREKVIDWMDRLNINARDVTQVQIFPGCHVEVTAFIETEDGRRLTHYDCAIETGPGSYKVTIDIPIK